MAVAQSMAAHSQGALFSIRAATGRSALAGAQLRTPLTLPSRLAARRSTLIRAEERGNTAVEEKREAQDKVYEAGGDQLKQVLKELPPDQQKAISNMYAFFVQHPDAKMQNLSWNDVQNAYNQYQTLLWRPAELLNGRMAMIGFVAAIANQAATGQSLWQQLYFAPYAYLLAYGLVVLGAVLNKQFGSPTKGIGPFTRTAELWNGRAAMLGYVILAYQQYNTELARGMATALQRLSQLQGGPGLGA